MTDFQIQPSGAAGDWDLVRDSDGDLVIVGDTADNWLELIRQRVAYAVMTWLGESPYDRSAGFPWEQSVFGRQPVEGIAALLYSEIEAVEGVDGIEVAPVIEFERKARRLSIEVTVQAGAFVVPVALTLSAEGETA